MSRREPGRRRITTPRRERGVVLVMSIIFLVILSFIGLYAMRNTIMSEQAGRNMRANELATAAAETALRYCEDTAKAIANGWLVDDAFKSKIQKIAGQAAGNDDEDGPRPRLPVQWETRGNWQTDGPMVITVPASELGTAGAGLSASASAPPRCMVERYQPVPEDKVSDKRVGYLVTAVGFGPGAQDDDSPLTSSSEAWLQTAFFGAPIAD